MYKRIFSYLGFLAVMSVFVIAFYACKKAGTGDYGCTDPTAVNYSASASKDDGSCIYNGSIVFWKNVPGPTVSVKLPDGTTGYITVTLTAAPLCTASGCLTYVNKPGSYAFSADDGLHTWSGTLTITSAKCTPYMLSL